MVGLNGINANALFKRMRELRKDIFIVVKPLIFFFLRETVEVQKEAANYDVSI